MGRSPGYSKDEGLNRGAWTAVEDQILRDYIKIHGEGRWTKVSKETGLRRHAKSCRLRWLNYLRPDIKRGNISLQEEDLIIRLHRLLGNRWSLIAGRLPGRTDNEIKNYWNSTLKNKVKADKSKEIKTEKKPMKEPFDELKDEHLNTKVAVEPSISEKLVNNTVGESESGKGLLPQLTCGNDHSWDFMMDLCVDDQQVCLSEMIHSDHFLKFSKLNSLIVGDCNNDYKKYPSSSSSEQSLFSKEMLNYWTDDDSFYEYCK